MRNYYYQPEEEGEPKEEHPFFGQDGEIENFLHDKRMVSRFFGFKKDWRETSWLSDYEEPQSSYPLPKD